MAAGTPPSCPLRCAAVLLPVISANRLQPGHLSLAQGRSQQTRASDVGFICVVLVALLIALAVLVNAFFRRPPPGQEVQEKRADADSSAQDGREPEVQPVVPKSVAAEASLEREDAASSASPDSPEGHATQEHNLAEIADFLEQCRERSMSEGDQASAPLPEPGPDGTKQVEEEAADARASGRGAEQLAFAGNMLSRLGPWIRRARDVAAAANAKEEFELSQVRLITENELPPVDNRVFPVPNLVKYKWVLRTCFEHDWKLLRARLLATLFSSEEECQVMEAHLFTKYMWVMPLYRKLSSEDCNDRGAVPDNISLFGVSKRSVISLLGSEGINIIDKTLTKANVEQLYAQANHTKPEDIADFQVRCQGQLARYQFAEFLLRVACAKWPEKSKVEALNSLFKELAVQCERYSGDMRKLLACGSDDVVQDAYDSLETLMRAVFAEMASVHETLHGEKMLTLADWRKVLNKSRVFESFPVIKRREVGYTYRMGLEAQADEQFNKTWQLLSFVEFQRALGAVVFLNEIRSKPKEDCLPTTLATGLAKFAEHDLSDILSHDRRASLKAQRPVSRRQSAG